MARVRLNGKACGITWKPPYRVDITRALAAELGKDGVRVNAIGPGLIETPLNAEARAKNPSVVQGFLEHTPLGRTGQPEDIVGPALFLASDLSAYVSGHIVVTSLV